MKSHQSTTASVWKNICKANVAIVKCNPWREEEDEATCRNINCILCCTPLITIVSIKASAVVVVSAAGIVVTPFALMKDAASCCQGPSDQSMDNDTSVANEYHKL